VNIVYLEYLNPAVSQEDDQRELFAFRNEKAPAFARALT